MNQSADINFSNNEFKIKYEYLVLFNRKMIIPQNFFCLCLCDNIIYQYEKSKYMINVIIIDEFKYLVPSNRRPL